MSDHHTARNVFGELTFGEYWNLAGCHAGAVMADGRKGICTKITVKDDAVQLVFEQFTPYWIQIRLRSKATVSGNKVTTRDDMGKPVALEFYDLTPTKSPV
jgi:hypothetical protein